MMRVSFPAALVSQSSKVTFSHSKKAQLSVVIILVGIMVIFSIVFLYVQKNTRQVGADAQQNAQREFEAKMLRIGSGIDSCVRDISWNGLEQLGNNGGWIAVPPIANYGSVYTYWYLDEVNVQPTLDEMRVRLEEHIESQLPGCVFVQVLQQQVSDVDLGIVRANVSFDAASVSVRVRYPIVLKYQGRERVMEEFSVDFPLRFRRMFELATQQNARLFDNDLEFERPMKNTKFYDMKMQQRVLPVNGMVDSVLLFNVTDPTRFVEGRNDFKMQFAARFGRGSLARVVDISKPFLFGVDFADPMRLFSLDKRSVILVRPLSSGFGPVVEHPAPRGVRAQVEIVQEYPLQVTRFQVPTEVENGDIKERRNFDYTALAYPVYDYRMYSFSFGAPQPWLFRWDMSIHQPQKFPRPQGEVGVLFFDGSNWKPIPSQTSYQDGFVAADISNLGKLTVADCAFQAMKDAKAVKKKDEGDSCMSIIPLCDQYIQIDKSEEKASGKCSPGTGQQFVRAGKEIQFCANMQSCHDKKERKCKVECKTQYK